MSTSESSPNDNCAVPDKTVVCLKWSNGLYNYPADWVNSLLRGVQRHLLTPFRFVCFTDDSRGLDSEVDVRDIKMLSIAPPLDGIWWKLALMHPQAGLTGRCLFMDLDVVVVGALDDFFSLPGRFCIVQNWIEFRKTVLRKRPLIGNSSVFRFEAGGEPQCAELFLQNSQAAKDDYSTEQAFMTAAVGLPNLCWWPEPWVRSFKYHCRQRWPLNRFVPPHLPPDTRILVFHGSPKQHEVINGVCGRRFSLPWSELAEHWQ